MTYHVSVLYPNDDDTTFDMKYYLGTHMPLVEKLWLPLGLLKWEIVEFSPAADGTKPQYRVAAHLTWKDAESFLAASKGPETTEIFADIPQFTTVKPAVHHGSVLAGN